MTINDVVTYLHCRQCIEARLPGQDIEAGLTENGFIIIHCRRHKLDVCQFQLANPPALKCAHPEHEHIGHLPPAPGRDKP